MYIKAAEIAFPEPDFRTEATKKKDGFELLVKVSDKEKHQRHNGENLLPKHHRNLDATTPNTIYDPQPHYYTHTGTAARSLNTTIPLRPADTELQGAVELRAAARERVRERERETAAPKPDLDAKAGKRRFCSTV